MNLALVNVKGGVGKTTTAVNLAASFAFSGLRTLLIDLDPQCSATCALGVEDDEPNVADIVIRRGDVKDSVQPTSYENLAILRGSLELAGADLDLGRRKAPVQTVRDALKKVSRRYDMVIIDAPPGLSLYSLMALDAAKAYIVPTVPHPLSLDALDQFFQGLESVGARLSKKPALLGILLTMVDHRTKLTDEQVKATRRKHGRSVLRTEIPLNVQLAVASGRGRSIFGHESWSTGGAAYRRLAGEVLRRARKDGLH